MRWLKTAVRRQTEKVFAENTVGIIQTRAVSADKNYKCLPVSLSGRGGAINIDFKYQMLKFPSVQQQFNPTAVGAASDFDCPDKLCF